MSKRIQAKHKLDRRMGQNIWGRPKSPVNRREYGPGQHGQRRKGKMSDFGTQLRAKQKLKGYYANITEKQFRRYYAEAIRLRGDSGENLIGLLERRLDAVVYRAKFVPTPFAARQFVNHGHVKVNGQRVNIASYLVKPGDLIEVKDSSKQLEIVVVAAQLPERDVPDYIEVDHQKMTARVHPRAEPRRGALPGPDGTEPGHRVLLALISPDHRRIHERAAREGGPFSFRRCRAAVDDIRWPRPASAGQGACPLRGAVARLERAGSALGAWWKCTAGCGPRLVAGRSRSEAPLVLSTGLEGIARIHAGIEAGEVLGQSRRGEARKADQRKEGGPHPGLRKHVVSRNAKRRPAGTAVSECRERWPQRGHPDVDQSSTLMLWASRPF